MRPPVEDPYERAWTLPQASLVAVELLEQAARLADAEGDVVHAFEVRQELCNRCMHTQSWDVFFVHFAWLVGQHDADPQRFPARRVMWFYKWVLEEAIRDPAIGRERLESLFDDFERRLRAGGFSLRPHHHKRAAAAAVMGDLEVASSEYAKWFDARRDTLADCRICELHTSGEVLEALGRTDEALATWQDVLSHAWPCAMVPAVTRAKLLRPLAQRGERRRASAYHRRGYADVRNTAYLFAQVDHVGYEISRERDPADALAMLERHLPSAVTALPLPRMELYRAGAWLLERLAADGRAQLAITVPDALGVPSEGGRVETEALRGALDDGARRIAEALDRRDGNGPRWAERMAGYAEGFRAR